MIYNKTLPIWDKKDDIIHAIQQNRVIIVAGETGSGKTTQIPKYCLAAGRGVDGKIGCTQPRRIAATTVARRIAEELGEAVGKSVGYKIRFDDRTSPGSCIKIMTDGILLAETRSDPNLYEYDTIMVDEAHERSLNIDFVLGILTTLLRKRKNLKLIITSATIDTDKFSRAFDHAPVIEVSGRMYPVEVEYFSEQPDPSDKGKADFGEQTHVETAARAVDRVMKKTASGDLLVFMPTEQDIRETCEIIQGRNYPGTSILPLYARLSGSEQGRVFSPSRRRKIIVATNIAETSITIPGITYVIDTGLARISQYMPNSRITSLPVLPVSKSSADQRKGRCGRVQNGVCIRLFSEEDYLSRPLFTPPEIVRSNLAEVILRMIELNLNDINSFPFIDKPSERSIKDGFNLLFELGAIEAVKEAPVPRGAPGHRLTATGALMAKMPVDPRLSRMLIQAEKEGCLNEIVVIAAALSIRDPRERPAEKTAEADQAHSAFRDPRSDFITLLTIWRHYQDAVKTENGQGGLKRFCRTHFLSFPRMREWCDIHSQLSRIVKACKMRMNSDFRNDSGDAAFYAPLHKSILSGFLSNIAMKKEKNLYTAARGREVMIFPGSGLFNGSGQWVVAAELVETSRVFARSVADIENGWLEEVGGWLCNYTHLHPHWEKNRGEVVALEQVSLFGLIIVADRKVSYGKINPGEASDIFIQSALVEGDVQHPPDFMIHNRRLMETIADMQNRLRSRDLLVGEQEIFRFYRKRLPDISDIPSLRRFIKQEGGDQFLKMTQETLLRRRPDEAELLNFPDSVQLGVERFRCEYRFDPGAPDDGVTAVVPSAAASSIPPESLDWGVPGFFKEKVTALIKGLPKGYRRRLAPAADTADIIAKQMPKAQDYLASALSGFIHRRFGIDIPASAWPMDDLPDHLRLRISVTDPEGGELYAGRDKAVLCKETPGPDPADGFEAARSNWEKSGVARWDFGDLPDSVMLEGENGAKCIFYPGLDKDDAGIHLRLFRHRRKALERHRVGVGELVAKQFSNELRFLKKRLILPEASKTPANYFVGHRALETKIFDSVKRDLFQKDIRTEKDFLFHVRSVAPAIQERGEKRLNGVIEVLDAYQECRSILSALEAANKGNRVFLDLLDGLRKDMERLVPAGFLDLYDTEKLAPLARYVKTIAIRAQRAVLDVEKDRQKAERVRPMVDGLNRLVETLTPACSEARKKAIEDYFWLLQEYKISIFAQELKTSARVSAKRLSARLKEIESMV